MAEASKDTPRVFLHDAKQLGHIRATAASDAQSRRIVEAAVLEADSVIKEGPFSVMQKAVTPPSGDKHDYMSQAPYFWPDPAKSNGLPYIRRDGEHNPEIKKISDHEQFGRMGKDACSLALAYYLTGKTVYADRAVLLLRTWFLNPATRMNPNLEFGQGIPGINTGRGIGIIESRPLAAVTDAAGLLAGAKTWTPADQQGLRSWLTEYLHWMLTSEKGNAEDAAKNNHGNWFDVQVTDIALFLDDRKLAKEMLKRVKTRRIALQIEPDGRQPLELARTNAWGYSNFSLDALTQLAVLGGEVGVDLWNYHTADGRSIHAAIEFLLPYASGAKKWDHRQIGGFHASAMEHTLQRAARAYRDPSFKQLAKQIADNNDDLETLLLD
ncbi:MAG TPA: alginate lyase family protein [Terracidiphilus sp.]|nr:alginate lyase family protein [Terracidiphilus sp.]